MKSLQGHLVAASPHLTDPNFYRSVVLLVHHDEEGAFGVVLNRPTEDTVAEFWEMLGAEPCPSDQRVNFGGPVAGPPLALHTDPAGAEMEILPGLYFSTRQEDLERIISQQQYPYRIFSGYSGWGEGQLEDELQVGSWLTTEATVDDPFSDPDELWKRIVRQIGLKILCPTIGDCHVPEDPSVN